VTKGDNHRIAAREPPNRQLLTSTGLFDLTTPGPIAPDAAAKRDAVDRVLACDDFVRTTRLKELLRFIVDEERAGRSDRLKAFVIAQAVFGRDETFDAQNDTIVRVEMGAVCGGAWSTTT